jgi:hypothetical protein
MALSGWNRVTIISALILGSISLPARADFHYVPHAPVPVAPPASAADMPQMAPAQQPVPIQSAPLAPAPMPVTPMASTTVPSSMMDAPVTRTTPTSGLGQGGQIAEGFGKHVPLVMALREIAPAGYQLGYGPGVSLGTMVDWQGGQPWQDVMKSVLSPLGLQASQQGSVVYIDAAR